jgi:pyrroline-5-carboxylate reductase
MNENTVAFIGAGNMARCLIAALVKQGYPPENIIASNRNPQKLAALASDFAIQTTEDNVYAAQVADVIVLAVKPQLMAEVCQAMLAGAPEIHEKLFVTVAAGLPVNRYRDWLGDVRIVRAMPNTPAQIGLGVTGLFPSQCSNYEKSFVDQLFRGCGRNVWLDDEAQINHIMKMPGPW